jgi:FdhE protein
MKREETETLNQRVGELVRLRPTHQEILEFYSAVMNVQLEAREKFQGKAALARDVLRDEKTKSFPVFQGRDIPINLEAARTVFGSLCDVARTENDTLRRGVDRIVEAVRDEKIDIVRILKEVIRGEGGYTDECCQSLGMNRDILVFLGRASVQPLAQETAFVVSQGVDAGDWTKGICPICGSLPILSELTGDEGRRMLICSLCGYEWSVPRLVCPFCGEAKHEGHLYLFVEGDETVRVDVCDGCKKYIKTLDTRKGGRAVFPLLEDVATLHLDMLAQEKGYERGSAQYLELT